MMFDIIITNGTIIDGTGNPPFQSDIGIKGERIEAIDHLDNVESNRIIDATNLIVAPGFIDTHTHSEGDLLINPDHEYGLKQGITTELLGIDGMSYAPLSKNNYLTYRHWLSGLLGYPPADLDMSSVSSFKTHYHNKVSINTAYLIPNGTVRLEVAGFKDVPLDTDMMKKYIKLVEQGFEQGAVGFSTGSSYYPGPWTSTKELIEICKLVKQLNGIYMSEPRRANPERAFKGGGVAEALEITEKSGVKLHIAHYRTDPTNAGSVESHMRLIDESKNNGSDITLDIYPYPSGRTIPVSYIPSWAQDGGPSKLLERLGNPSAKKKIADELEQSVNYSRQVEDMIFSYSPNHPELEGQTLPDLAKSRNSSIGETLCDLLISENLELGYVMPPPVNLSLWRQVSKDCMDLLARDDYMVCSDITPAGSMPHPRTYGAFPRILGRLHRTYNTMSLENLVHRMTERPALRFGLTNRGKLHKGYFADITIFDKNNVIDTSTYDDPKQYPSGIPYVLVNGRVSIDNHVYTGAKSGKSIP